MGSQNGKALRNFLIHSISLGLLICVLEESMEPLFNFVLIFYLTASRLFDFDV